jgi:uncharacterized protein (TIGR00369 family)
MKKPYDPLFRARKQLKAAPFPRQLGLKFIELVPGRAVIRMPNRSQFRQYRGQTHGGAIAALIDTAATFATNSLIDASRDSVTIELKVNFIKSGTGRYLEARAEILHHGRTTSITRIEVRAPNGALCAFATATNLLYTSAR